MGNCLKTCYENVNEIGPNPRRFTCPICNKKKWRNIYSYQYDLKTQCSYILTNTLHLNLLFLQAYSYSKYGGQVVSLSSIQMMLLQDVRFKGHL